MKSSGNFLASSSLAVVLKVFFACIKMMVILLVLVVGALVASQSSVAPVSVRLLTSYAMEYAVSTFKPVRPYFPAPQVVEIETH